MAFRLYFHQSCATSREVILGLSRRGLLERVELIPLDGGIESLRAGVWSVPWLVIDGMPVATDPVTADEVAEIINGGKVDVGDPLDAFMNAVLHSSLATALTLLHGSVAAVADPSLASAAARSPLTGVDPEALAARVRAEGDRLFLEWRDKLRRAATVSYVRELYWASGGAITAEELAAHATQASVGAWLIAKGSLGRAALPPRPKGVAREDAEWIASFVRRAARGLLEKVREEQESIYSDSEYLGLLRARGINIPP